MAKLYEVRSISTASGTRYAVAVYDGDQHIETQSFSPGQTRVVKNAAGFKVREPIKETAKQRCDAYCAALEAQGYERKLSDVEKLVKDMIEMSRETSASTEEHIAHVENMVASVAGAKAPRGAAEAAKAKIQSNLARHRKAKGLSRQGLSDLAGVSVRMVSYYENGSKDINKAEALSVLKLAEALECDVRDILEI